MLAWLAQRALFAGLFELSARLFGRPGASPGASLSLAVSSSPWLNWWDTGHYLDIARAGYRTPDQTVFYPLYPLLERWGAKVLGGDYVLAGFVVANLACLLALVAFRMLAEVELGGTSAQVALACFTLCPMAVYLAVTYSESLFLLCAIFALLALRRGRWLAAGAGAALAVLTRQSGVLLAAPIAVEAGLAVWNRRRVPTVLLSAAAVVAAPLALVLFAGHLAQRFGSWSVPVDAERIYFRRYLDWPWVGVSQAAGVLLAGPLGPSLNAAYDLAVTAFMAVATVVTAVWSRIALSHRLYVLLGFLALLMLPMHGYFIGEDLNGLPRYLIILFPVWLGLAAWAGDSLWRRGLVIGACFAGFATTVVLFGHRPFLM